MPGAFEEVYSMIYIQSPWLSVISSKDELGSSAILTMDNIDD